MIRAPLLLIVAPLVMAGAVYFIRRLTFVASLLSAATALGVGWLANAAPQAAEESMLGGRVVGGPLVVLGRTLEVSPADRLVLLALSLAAAALFLLAARLRPGDIFFPGLLALLGTTAAVLVTETFVFSVLLVEVTAGVATMLIQGSRFGSTRGAWRFFIFNTLAMPFLLVAGWQIDFQTANPGQTALLSPAVLLLTLGFAIYLTAVPFHLWVAPTARESPPLVQVVVFGLLPMVTLSVIMNALESFPWLAASGAPFQWFSFAGALTAALGAILALGTRSFGELAGYSLLVDMGALLMLLGLRSHEGLQAAWAVLLLRVASLVVWATGLSIIRLRTGSDQVGRAAGTGWHARLATIALVAGGLSLAGFPLTPGFPGRWVAVELIARESLIRGAVLLLGSATGALGMLRMAGVLFAPRPGRSNGLPAGRWEWLTTVAMVAVLLAAAYLALFPQAIFSAGAHIAAFRSVLQ